MSQGLPVIRENRGSFVYRLSVIHSLLLLNHLEKYFLNVVNTFKLDMLKAKRATLNAKCICI
jgi:hypothetical protein